MLFLDANGNYCEAKIDHAAGGICLGAQPAAAAIVQQTLERYDAAPATIGTRIAPFSRARIRDALGYKEWTPPIVEPPVPESATIEGAPRTGTDAGVAAMASRLRMVRLDRVLHWLNPARIRDAVKARLR